MGFLILEGCKVEVTEEAHCFRIGVSDNGRPIDVSNLHRKFTQRGIAPSNIAPDGSFTLAIGEVPPVYCSGASPRDELLDFLRRKLFDASELPPSSPQSGFTR